MPYCFSCGKLRETIGGLCRQCYLDDQVRRDSAAKYEHARIMRDIKRAAAKEKSAAILGNGDDGIAQEEESLG